MRIFDGIFELRPSLIGTISTIGGTAVGIPVDTMGFKDVLAVLTAGALAGSAGSTVYLDVKVQESATPEGTGALWSDIKDGAYSGTFDFTQMTFSAATTGTWIPYQAQKQYEQVGGNDASRKRYIRAHATLSGTVGLGPKISCAFLLGRPTDTLYINNATSFASTNVELTQLL